MVMRDETTIKPIMLLTDDRNSAEGCGRITTVSCKTNTLRNEFGIWAREGRLLYVDEQVPLEDVLAFFVLL